MLVRVPATYTFQMRQVSVRLQINSESNSDGAVLVGDKSWKAPPNGWLVVRDGKWKQAGTAGVVLQKSSETRIGLLQGLDFDSATEGTTGVFVYDAGGDTGSYEVIDVRVDLPADNTKKDSK